LLIGVLLKFEGLPVETVKELTT